MSITRYVRFTTASGAAYGLVEGDTIHELAGDLFEHPRPTGRTVPLADAELLLPLDPSRVQKVIGVALNYYRPGVERAIEHPRWFAKLTSALNPHGADVELPPDAANMNFEGELVLIIGRKGRRIPVENAPGYIFGVTVGNDWSENTWFYERRLYDEPSQLISKSIDTWACLYTTIVTGLDCSDLAIETRLNGELVATGRTNNMINSPARLVSYISQYATLMPGDVIYTGRVAPPLPGTRAEMRDGDVVEIAIEHIGVLRNRVVAG